MTKMRYAIYYLPDETSLLWRFGSAVIGYDSISAAPVQHTTIDLQQDLALITQEPRTYGFHATLKAPFRLANGATEATLLDAAKRFASHEAIVEIGQLEITALGSFIALTAELSHELREFAERCVRAFEPFRATMTTEERAKRLRAPLSVRQVELMEAWGYPFVFDQFRFHMTLTSSLAPEIQTAARDALAASYSKLRSKVSLTSVCVCVQPQGERFRLLRRFPLAPVSS